MLTIWFTLIFTKTVISDQCYITRNVSFVLQLCVSTIHLFMVMIFSKIILFTPNMWDIFFWHGSTEVSEGPALCWLMLCPVLDLLYTHCIVSYFNSLSCLWLDAMVFFIIFYDWVITLLWFFIFPQMSGFLFELHPLCKDSFVFVKYWSICTIMLIELIVPICTI